LINCFKIRKNYFKVFDRKYGALFKVKTLVINYRLKEYKNFIFSEIDSSASLGTEWYEKVLDMIDINLYSKVLIISDDIEEARLLISDRIINPIFIDDEWFFDYQCLLNGDCLIIPNSSFSWWGAYLNAKMNKVVYAPKNWVGYNAGIEYPKGIM